MVVHWLIFGFEWVGGHGLLLIQIGFFHIICLAILGLIVILESQNPHIIQHIAESIYPHEPPPQAIHKSILDDDDDIAKAVNEADLVVDVSTTFEVPRTLALKDDIPRIVSLFLTPSGQSSVMLMEDIDRQCRIDAIEGQYYRAILSSEWGSTHLTAQSMAIVGSVVDVGIFLYVCPVNVFMFMPVSSHANFARLHSKEMLDCVSGI